MDLPDEDAESPALIDLRGIEAKLTDTDNGVGVLITDGVEWLLLQCGLRGPDAAARDGLDRLRRTLDAFRDLLDALIDTAPGAPPQMPPTHPARAKHSEPGS